MKRFLFFILLLSPILSFGAFSEDCFIEIDGRMDENIPLNQLMPDVLEDFTGSAPLTIYFSAQTNASSVSWKTYEEGMPDNYFNMYGGIDEFPYTYHATGYFWAVAQAMDPECVNVKDSVLVTVSDSDLQAPNLMSPNGDNYNDRFCVGYRSITKYNCHIYNRWGRLVFNSDKPEECWDGRIGGKDADIGVYYYVIEAEGADGRKFKLGGDLNLVR